ncbi:MAG: VWA domain-containing protein [Bdellovibrionota bacterium]
MNFLNLNYLPYLILAIVVFLGIVVFFENRFFTVIKRYWFYKRSLVSWVSSFLFLIGMAGLILSLLDARGPEEKVKTPVPKQRTIILIDTSASMLAEDVKPSRLQKATLIAKHFARKAAGHQLSIVAFAEIQKPIVPFTNDLDLIDARLDSIKFLRNQYGSSALSVAVQESIQYFYDGGGEMRGNIIVFTDGEETSAGVKLKVPEGIHIAFVGVGTNQGGRIPLDDGRGFRFGYKKDRGQDVITKLNENFFKSTVSDLPSAKYWLANTYSLPSEEILEFFQSEEKKSEEKQDMIIRPVMMEWIVLPSILLLILSYFFKAIRVFTLGMFLIISPGRAQDEKVQYTPELIKKMEELQAGKLNPRQKVKLADDLYRAGGKEEALALFDENLPKDGSSPDIPKEAYLNYGTALLETGRGQEALSVYESLDQQLGNSPEASAIREKMEKNTLSYFRQEKQKKEQQKKDQQNKDKDNKENKDNKDGKDPQNQSGDNKDQQNQSGKDQQKQGQSGQQDKNEQQKKDEKDKGEEKKDGEGEEDNKEKPKDGESEDGQEKKPLPPKKLAPKLKQLMSDDRQLQMRMIEQGTRELNRKKLRNSKDW